MKPIEESTGKESPFSTGKISTGKTLEADSLNNVYQVDIEGDGRGIYKNEAEERETMRGNLFYRKSEPMMNLEACSMVRREVATARLAKQLGIDFVPETVFKEGKVLHLDGIGSTQMWIDDLNVRTKGRGNFFKHLNAVKENDAEVKMMRDQVSKAEVFDKLIGATDRHAGNVGVDKDFKIWLIDNGNTFAHSPDKAWNGGFGKASEYTQRLAEHADINPNLSVKQVRTVKKKIANELKKKAIDNKAAIDTMFQDIGLPDKEKKAFWERAENLSDIIK